MRTLCLVVALAGCIEPSLVPCDETLCPIGTACGPSGGCIAEDQLAACLGLDEREDCELGVGAGVCMMGVCQPKICGNDIRTPDEVCDDGDNVNGDGCSADCLSDESCGNGITDGATGEACDDGNTADGDDCRADCTLPRCGDGTVDGFEQCEPGDPATDETTCEAFGFYEGTVVCGSQCRYTPEGCTGRCGDGMVQAAFGEECDGGPPAFTCVDQGFDHGVLGCTERCVGDLLETCERFGWRQVDAATGDQVAADGTTYVVGGGTRFTIVRGSERQVFFDTGLQAVDVLGETVLVARFNGVRLYDATNTPRVLPDIANVIAAKLAADGTPYALTNTGSSCSLLHVVRDLWQGVQVPSNCRSLFLLNGGDAVVGVDGGLHWLRTAGDITFTRLRLGQLVGVESAGSELYAYFLETSPPQIVRETVTDTGDSRETRVVVGTFGGTIASTVKDGAAYAVLQSGALVRGSSGRSEGLELPSARARAPVVARDGRLLLLSDDGVFVARSMVRGTRKWDLKIESPGLARAAVTADGALVLCSDEVFIARGDMTALVPLPRAQCGSALATEGGAVFVVRRTDLTDAIYQISPDLTPGNEYSGPGIEELAAAGATIVARTATAILRRSPIGIWTPLPALPCTATRVAVADTPLASCPGANGGVYALEANEWTRVFAGDVSVLAVAPDKTVFVTLPDGGAMRPPGASDFVDMPQPGSPVVRLVAAGENELYADVLGDNFVHRWDGTAWSPLAFPPGDAMVVTPDEIISVAPDASQGSVFARLSMLLRGVN